MVTCTHCNGTGVEVIADISPGANITDRCVVCGGLGRVIELPTRERMAFAVRSYPEDMLREPDEPLLAMIGKLEDAFEAYKLAPLEQQPMMKAVWQAARMELFNFLRFHGAWNYEQGLQYHAA